jgi:WD40 repeat protein
MSDILISYSRKDLKQVKALYNGLRQQELDVWIDLEGIPPTVEWMAEIENEIERADGVLMVISPDWVESEICALELDLAMRLNKRIIPVLVRETDTAQIHDQVRRLNFIITLSEETQEKAIGRIIEALHTDYDMLRRHTRLLSRARQWDNSGRDTSLLFRGQELTDAESWLNTDNLDPAPTALHREHIATSHAHAQKRRRVLYSTVALVAVIAVIAAVFYSQELDRSELRAKIAGSRKISSIALDRIGKAEDQALLLAMAAYKVYPTLESRDTLQRALMAQPGLSQLSPLLDDAVLALTFTPNAAGLLIGMRDGSVKKWNLAGKSFDTLMRSEGKSVASMAFTSVGSHIVTGRRESQRVDWIRLDNHAATALPAAREHDLTAVSISPDGTTVAAANGLGGQGISLWQIEQPEQRRILATPDSFGATAVCFSSSGKQLAVAGYDPRVAIYDVASAKLIATLDTVTGDGIYALDIGPKGRWIAAGSGETIFLGDLRNPTQAPRQLVWPNHGMRSVAFSPNGRWLAAGYADGFVGLWDLNSRSERPRSLIGLGKYVDLLAFDPSSRLLAAGGFDKKVAIWDLTRVSGIGQLIGTMKNKVTSIAISENGRMVASGSEDAITLWSAVPRSRPLHSLSGTRTWVSSLIFSDMDKKLSAISGRYLLSGRSWAGYMRWDISGETALAETSAPPEIPLSYLEQMAKNFGVPMNSGFNPMPELVLPTAISTDGITVAATDLPRAPTDLRPVITIGRIGEDKTPHALQTDHTRELQNIALSPDGSLVASVGGDRVEVWSTSERKKLRVFNSPDGSRCTDVTFLPDNSLAATCGDAVWRFSGNSGEPNAIANPGAKLQRIAAGAPGTHLATLDKENALQLWDETTDRPIGIKIPVDATITSMHLHKNGQRLVTGHSDGSVVLWRFDPAYWQQLACQLAGRDLTPEEWASFVGGEKRHVLCAEN